MIIGLGSNRRHGRHGRPEQVLAAALSALSELGLEVSQATPPRATRPLGRMGGRRYANAALSACWAGTPAELLHVLQAVERAFGRRRGRRWGPRVLDLDLWVVDGMTLAGRPGQRQALDLPHPRLAERDFALADLGRLWPEWRWPGTALSARHRLARLKKARPVAPAGQPL